jgi:hypothetical protein
MMQSHGVKLESAERSYFHLCCRQFGSASKITILDACEYKTNVNTTYLTSLARFHNTGFSAAAIRATMLLC